MKKFILIALTIVAARGQAFLDKIDERLYIECPKCDFRSDLSVLADLEAYTIDQNPPGLLYSHHDVLIQPRLSLFLDTRLGKHFYSLVQFRVDRGFDPGSKPDGQARFDEYLLRYTPFDESWVNLQFGKFATFYGNFVPRHDSWNNPFINAPLPYENISGISDQAAAPTRTAFLKRRTQTDIKEKWLPIIWGPSYTSGGAIFGTVEKLDYAFEFKNASLSSRPEVWDAFDTQWSHPTYTGRLGYRPNAAWNVGANASYGSYLLPSAAKPGLSIGDFQQITVGPDVSFSWRHWQFWAEAMASRYEVPNVGDAETVAYYVESRYKFTPKLFGALRWNQQLFDDVKNAAGMDVPWDRDMWRAEAAIGYRFTRHLQTKLQYSYSHQKGSIQQGEQMAAAQLTLKF
jgi:hypothetical protein